MTLTHTIRAIKRLPLHQLATNNQSPFKSYPINHSPHQILLRPSIPSSILHLFHPRYVLTMSRDGHWIRWGGVLELKSTSGQHGPQNCKVNTGQHWSKLVKLGQSWSNEVKSHMKRPKSMEKGNTMSEVNSEDKSSEFEAKRSEMTGAEQSQRTIWTSKQSQTKLKLGQKEHHIMWKRHAKDELQQIYQPGYF